MRTFDDIQYMIETDKARLMERSRKELEAGGLQDYKEHANTMIIRDCQDYLDNIDEVTTIDIGATTNDLIRAIQTGYKLHQTYYWQNFKRFATEYIVGLTPEGNFINGPYLAQIECYKLGIGVQELAAYFEGRNPFDDKTGDGFRNFVNTNLGTNIPMAGTVEKAREDWEAVAFGDDLDAKDRAFCTLKEQQRDNGDLKNGGIYYLLATNQTYQVAKARCSGPTL